MGDVGSALDVGVYNALMANATIAGYPVWNSNPPPNWKNALDENGRELPFVIFQQIAESYDDRTFGKRGVIIEMLVKAIVEADFPADATAVSSQIDDVMEGASLTVSGFTHLDCTRTSGVRFSERTAGRTYWHAGGIYRIWEEPT